MKISINQAELSHALTIMRSGLASRPSLPILSGVCFKAYGNTLTLQTTDLKSSVQYQTKVLVEEEGQTVIPAKLLIDIIKTLPDSAVHITTDQDNVSILCEAASFALKTMPAEDFPGFPELAPEESITLSFDIFSHMVKRVSRVASRDESRMILTGVLVSKEAGTIKMVATDAYRLAIAEKEGVASGSEDFEAVIESAFLQHVASLPKDGEDITLSLAENQIIIRYGDTIFINRRIEGNYPNYRRLLPSGYDTRVVFDTNKLATAVKRISLLSTPTSPMKFEVNSDSQSTQLSTVAEDVGAAQETLQAEVMGTDLQIAFNYTYVLDGLNVMNTDSVLLDLQGSDKPGIFRANSEDNFLYLVMPIELKG